MSMKKAIMATGAAAIAMSNMMDEVKEIKNQSAIRKANYNPPRSMTEKEKEWYAVHKSLKGFNHQSK